MLVSFPMNISKSLKNSLLIRTLLLISVIYIGFSALTIYGTAQYLRLYPAGIKLSEQADVIENNYNEVNTLLLTTNSSADVPKEEMKKAYDLVQEKVRINAELIDDADNMLSNFTVNLFPDYRNRFQLFKTFYIRRNNYDWSKLNYHEEWLKDNPNKSDLELLYQKMNEMYEKYKVSLNEINQLRPLSSHREILQSNQFVTSAIPMYYIGGIALLIINLFLVIKGIKGKLLPFWGVSSFINLLLLIGSMGGLALVSYLFLQK